MITLKQMAEMQARISGKRKVVCKEGVERESDLHAQIAEECRRRGWYFVRSRMDKRTTNQKGVPDFIVAADGGRTYWVELKSRIGKLTAEQSAAKLVLEMNGHRHFVCRSIGEFLRGVSEDPEFQHVRD